MKPEYYEMPQEQGGADFSLVRVVDNKPFCIAGERGSYLHGAMNKVTPSPPDGPGFWRCIASWKCRAGCQEVPNEEA